MAPGRRAIPRVVVWLLASLVLCPPTALAARPRWLAAPARWELRTGYGYQYTNEARPNNYQIHPLLPSLVIPLSGPMGPGGLRGRWAWNPELLFILFTHPYDRLAYGITPLQFRYELVALGRWPAGRGGAQSDAGRWSPYVTLGAGVLHAVIHRRETRADTNFNVQGAVGVRWGLTPRTGLLLEYRHIHISNAGLHEDNAGLNTHTFLAGVSREF